MSILMLAAGYATRLYPLTENTAKALLPLSKDILIADLLVDKFSKLPSEKIFVISNEKFYPDFKNWANNKQTLIDVVSDRSTNTQDMLGAIGDVEYFLEKSKISDGLFIFGGDNLFSWDLEEFYAFCKKVDAPVVGTYDMKNTEEVAGRYGVVELDSNKKIVSFEEKPQNPKSALIGTCIYYLPSRFFKHFKFYFDAGHSKDAIGLFFSWLSQNVESYGFTFEGEWIDIGHLDTLKAARDSFLSGKI